MKSDPASPGDSGLPNVPAPPAPESTPAPVPPPEAVPVILEKKLLKKSQLLPKVINPSNRNSLFKGSGFFCLRFFLF